MDAAWFSTNFADMYHMKSALLSPSMPSVFHYNVFTTRRRDQVALKDKRHIKDKRNVFLAF